MRFALQNEEEDTATLSVAADSEGDDAQMSFSGMIGGVELSFGLDAYEAQQLIATLLPLAQKGELPNEDDEDGMAEAKSWAASFVADGLVVLYQLNDGDEAAVGEALYEINKGARRAYAQEVERR